ncbi:LytR/AlgR family response regulator transcription factor [Rubrivirga sp. IMCC43871]|uniref:LytR/AlgR family response regulator transcription factor n=1 Tax=Rubrivirga sp. IMCC43871 TaxID=3391575 RepID=UPI00398F9C30
MDPLYTLVAGGDAASRNHVADCLNQFPDVAVVDVCGSTLAAARALATRPVQLLVLDSDLPPDGARAALERIGEDVPPAVVVTGASAGDGLWAFGAGAVDCLESPIHTDRLLTAIHRARERVQHLEVRRHRDELLALLDGSDPAPPPSTNGHPLVVRSGSQLVFLDPKDVDWVEASGVYVSLHCNGTCHLLRETLRHVEEHLDSGHFVRIHRSTIINVTRVRRIVPHLNGGAVVLLKDGTQLKMSRSYRERISATLG